MHKRSSKSRQRSEALKLETEPAPAKNPAAVALGRLGGLKGGKARAAKLSDEERSEIAKKAAKARWSSKNRGAEQ